jgi:hypothetical protein
MVLGGIRPTGDVDFELRLARRHAGLTPAVEAAVSTAAERAGVAVQWSTDIDRWSSVSVPSRRHRSRPFRTIGRLRVRLLDPSCWAVYKLARYLEPDIEDLRVVLRRERVDPRRLARLCGEALRTSPRSTALFQFRRQVEDFFRTHGPSVWRGVDADRAIATFHRAAGIGRR